MTLNLYPGVIKIDVSFSKGCKMPFSSEADSNNLKEVVPTEIILRPSFLA